LVIKQETSVGANIGMIMMAVEQEYDELNMAIKMFQDTMMRVRYSSIPVISTTRNDFGGGCEMSLHADKVVAAAETYKLSLCRCDSWWWWF
jgi:3-hydroxyacyl-CoA dehydrogenase